MKQEDMHIKSTSCPGSIDLALFNLQPKQPQLSEKLQRLLTTIDFTQHKNSAILLHNFKHGVLTSYMTEEDSDKPKPTNSLLQTLLHPTPLPTPYLSTLTYPLQP